MKDPNANRPGFYKTKLGWIPQDWQCVPLSDAFTQRKNKGEPGLPVLSVTMDQGMILRSSLDRKMESEVSPEDSLLVEPGDIAYNMMRMWQGAVTVADMRGVVSPAYVVCRPRKGVDPRFMLYQFKSHLGLYRLWANSYGITGDRLRLYFPDFALVSMLLPPLAKQKKITQILSTWDVAIEKTNGLIAAKKEHKKALMQQLIPGKRRLPGFEGKWQPLRLSAISERITATVESPTGYDVLSITAGAGFVSQADKFSRVIAGKHIENYILLKRGEFSYNKGNSIRFPQGCVYQLNEYDEGLVPDVFYSFRLKPAKVCDGFVRQFFFAGLHNEQLYRCINTGVRNNGLLNLSATDFFNIKIRLPELAEQRAIAAVLTTADREIAALEAKLVALKEQKKGLMQKLLTGEIRVSLTKGSM